MHKNSILKITSSSNSTIGTGFVIDKQEQRLIVVTCSHVLNACNPDAILVEEGDFEGLL